MKIRYFLKIILWLSVAVFYASIFGACSKKVLLQNKSTEISKSSDSVKIIEATVINNKVRDSIFRKIGLIQTSDPNCDSITKAYVEYVLSSMETKKTSGDNSYGFYYDKYRKMFVAYANLAETVSKSRNLEHKSNTQTTITLAKEVPVKWMPWYVIALAGIGGAAVFYLGYSIIKFFAKPRLV